jgi:hypothetical protein
VKAAIEGDPTLGGKADTVRVLRAETAAMTVGGADYLAATFETEVIA